MTVRTEAGNADGAVPSPASFAHSTKPGHRRRGQSSLECLLVFDVSGEIGVVSNLRCHAACLVVSELALDEVLQDVGWNGHTITSGRLMPRHYKEKLGGTES